MPSAPLLPNNFFPKLPLSPLPQPVGLPLPPRSSLPGHLALKNSCPFLGFLALRRLQDLIRAVGPLTFDLGSAGPICPSPQEGCRYSPSVCVCAGGGGGGGGGWWVLWGGVGQAQETVLSWIQVPFPECYLNPRPPQAPLTLSPERPALVVPGVARGPRNLCFCHFLLGLKAGQRRPQFTQQDKSVGLDRVGRMPSSQSNPAKNLPVKLTILLSIV